MIRRTLAILIVVAACSPATEGTTTTFLDTTSTSETTTTTVGDTTTTLASTTTTEPPTTTTTEPPTTTTTGVQGNWAAQPLIVARMGALGWWNGASWIDAQEAGALPVSGGESYQVARIGIAGEVVTGGPPTTQCEPFVNNLGVDVDQPGLLGDWPGPAGVAVSAPWELQPHLVEAFNDDGTYSQFAKDLLANRGLNVDSPTVKQAFRLDLEGDGINEVLVVAEGLTNGYFTTNGDYSIVFLRKVIEGEVATAVLAATVITDETTQYFVGYSVGAITDLNGDAKMEMILNMADSEGFGVGMWEYVNNDLGPVLIFQTGCGA